VYRRPNPPPETEAITADRRILEWLWPLLLGMLVGLGFRLIFRGNPTESFNVMGASFTLLVPIAVAAVTVYAAERTKRRSWSFYFWSAAGANTLFVIGTFLVLIEGLICTVLAVPLFAAIGGVAGLLTGAACRQYGHSTSNVLPIVVLPLVFGAVDQHIPLPNRIDTVSSTRLIQAPPEQVWRAIANATDIREEEIGSALMYRIGVPLPLSATTEASSVERVRHIRMGKNIAFDQVIVDWEPERRVRYTYRFEPNSFPPRALDDHVRIGGDFFDLHDTEYRLEPVHKGTLLTARMSYRVSTHFNWYARPVARLLVGNFEEAALGFYAQRAESANVEQP
jgi:uncharacterized protein YndB with AHSA1/START domain